MTDAEIKSLADRVLGPRLAGRGLERIEVRVDREDPDDPVLFVEATIRAGAERLGGSVRSDALHALSQELLRAGEMRFPHLRVHYAGEEEPEGDFPEFP